MKRKGCEDASENDRKAARLSHEEHVPISAAAQPTLSKLPNELVTCILSYMDFYDRSKLRRVCRQFLEVVDRMPACCSLKIFVDEYASFGNRSWASSWNADTKLISIGMDPSGEYPILTTLQPTRVHIESPPEEHGGNCNQISASLVKHIASCVSKTVTNVSIRGIKSTSKSQLQEALMAFEEQGPKVKDLEISMFHSLAENISAVTTFKNLSSLRLLMQDEMVPHNPGLGMLDCLPNLRVLKIHNERHESLFDPVFLDDPGIAMLLIEYSSIPQLERISSIYLCYRGNRSGEAFAIMSQRLPNLKSLGRSHRTNHPILTIFNAVFDLECHIHGAYIILVRAFIEILWP